MPRRSLLFLACAAAAGIAACKGYRTHGFDQPMKLGGKTAPVSENPWGVTTLEWTATTSPPPFHNFERIPEVVRGPHEFANPEVLRLTGRDFIGQAEQLPGLAEPPLAAAKG